MLRDNMIALKEHISNWTLDIKERDLLPHDRQSFFQCIYFSFEPINSVFASARHENKPFSWETESPSWILFKDWMMQDAFAIVSAIGNGEI